MLQYIYKNSIDSDVSKILKMSDELKIKSKSKYYLFYNLFPDEIDSNIRAANIINKLDLFDISEYYLIESLTISMKYDDYLVPSQLQFLYKQILEIDINDDFSLDFTYNNSNILICDFKLILFNIIFICSSLIL